MIYGNGTVTNSGLISSAYGDGIYIRGLGAMSNSVSIVTNSGTIDGGVLILGNGMVTNSGIVGGGILIIGNATVINTASGSMSNSIQISTGTVSNSGSLGGFIDISGDGEVTNAGSVVAGIGIEGTGTITNTGIITNGAAVISGNGMVSNSGSIGGGILIEGNGTAGNSGLISAVNDGIQVRGNGSVTNSGAVSSTSAGAIEVDGGGSIANSGVVSANNTVSTGLLLFGQGTVTNSGSVTGGYAGIVLNSNSYYFPGTVINTGHVNGGLAGIVLDYPGTVINSGSVTSQGDGIKLVYGGNILLAGGSITSGSNIAVETNVYIGSTNSPTTITVLGRSRITGVLEDDNGVGTLNLDLVGLTPTQFATLRTLAGQTSGTFTAGAGYTYTWNNLTLVDDSPLSLEELVDPGLIAAASRIDNFGQGLPASYNPFFNAAALNPEAAMNTLVGREINQGIDTLGVSQNTTLAASIGQHLDNLFTGNQVGGLNVGDLNVNNTGLYAFSNTSAQLDSLAHLVGSHAMLSASTDPVPMVSTPTERWGAWVSGDITFADESASNNLSGYRANIGSPMLGVDYQVCPNLVLGSLFNYTTSDATFGDGSQINSRTELGALYGTWRQGDWHAYGLAGIGATQYHDQRAVFGNTANSSPNGLDILTDWTGGYDFKLGRDLTITPEIGLQYTHLDVDSYTESNAGAFNLAIGDQNIDSLRSHVGFHLNKAFIIDPHLQFIPEFRAIWYHEYLDDSRGISTSLPGAPAVGSFATNTFSPERDFAMVGAGLKTAFTGYHDMPVGLFINYNAQVGQNDYVAHSIDAGMRVDF